MTDKLNAIIVADLGFGDAGKGSVVDAIVRQTGAHIVVRYNGGCQAAHRVVAPGGKEHIFAQFGSGMLVPGVETHLSRFMFIDPIAMMQEEEFLVRMGVCDAFDRTTIDANAVVITPFHRAANRIREIARGTDRHGSCGRGVGEAAFDAASDPENLALSIGDIAWGVKLAEKLAFIRGVKYAQVAPLIKDLPDKSIIDKELHTLINLSIDDIVSGYRDFVDKARVVTNMYLSLLSKKGIMVFEGAQGVLLDQRYGFTPYTTWSNTTFDNALVLLEESSYKGKIVKLGVIRAYATRHGPGPFPTENSALELALTHEHNKTGPWQGPFRVGWLDTVLLRYAIEVCGGIDCLAVNHLDQLESLSKRWASSAYAIPRTFNLEVVEDFFDSQIFGLAQRIKLSPTDSDSETL